MAGVCICSPNGRKRRRRKKEEEEEEEEAEEESAGPLRIAEESSQWPLTLKQTVCVYAGVDGGPAGIVTVVTNAVQVAEGMLVVLAPVGSTTPGSGMKIEKTALRGVDSHGMLCSAYDIGWTSEADGVLVQLPEEECEVGEDCPEEPPVGAVWGPLKKEKKKKKKTVDMDSAFAALAIGGEGGEAEGEGDDEEEAAAAATAAKKEKKEEKEEENARYRISFCCSG